MLHNALHAPQERSLGRGTTEILFVPLLVAFPRRLGEVGDQFADGKEEHVRCSAPRVGSGEIKQWLAGEKKVHVALPFKRRLQAGPLSRTSSHSSFEGRRRIDVFSDVEVFCEGLFFETGPPARRVEVAHRSDIEFHQDIFFGVRLFGRFFERHQETGKRRGPIVCRHVSSRKEGRTLSCWGIPLSVDHDETIANSRNTQQNSKPERRKAWPVVGTVPKKRISTLEGLLGGHDRLFCIFFCVSLRKPPRRMGHSSPFRRPTSCQESKKLKAKSKETNGTTAILLFPTSCQLPTLLLPFR
mmetsp:Transcript_30424/g.78728  ORF Transcript_30424/g.78728 Transcript_30424/m.78728 type:complete len:299 (+) Transcript_30424:4194-5090(+)